MATLIETVARFRDLIRRAPRAAIRRVHRVGGRLSVLLRKLPIPQAVKDRVALLRLQPRSQLVPIDKILLGGQGGLMGADFARAIDDLAWSSTLLTDGPFFEFFEAIENGALDPDDPDALLRSPYGQHALRCIATNGAHFGAENENGVAELLREWFVPQGLTSRPSRSSPTREADRLPRLRRVRGTSYFTVADGHHRLSRIAATGANHAEVRIEWLQNSTALLDHLETMRGAANRRVLLQPVNFPEVSESWTVERPCEDQMRSITRFLDEQGITGGASLDVGAAYGWFVAEFERLGFDSLGVEGDPLAPPLGQAAYGLDPDRIIVEDEVGFLRSTDRTWNVVSCLDVRRMVLVAQRSTSSSEILGLLDKITGDVLFLDAGPAGERATKSVVSELLATTTFEQAIPLRAAGDSGVRSTGDSESAVFAITR